MDEVIQFLQNLPEEKWTTKVNENWTIKEVVAHLVAWNYEEARVIPETLETGKSPWFFGAENVDDFNAEAVAKYQKFLVKELLNELSKSENELNGVIEKYGEENLRNRPGFKWLFTAPGKKAHSVKHLDQIKEVLGE
jgi:hypothetical protein